MIVRKRYPALFCDISPNKRPIYAIAPRDSFPEPQHPVVLGTFVGLHSDKRPIYAVQNKIFGYNHPESRRFACYGDIHPVTKRPIYITHSDGPPAWEVLQMDHVRELAHPTEWTVRMRFHDSAVCGGHVPASEIPRFLAQRRTYLHPVPVKIKAAIYGRISRAEDCLAYARVAIYDGWGAQRLQLLVESPKDGSPCQMADVEDSGEVVHEFRFCLIVIVADAGANHSHNNSFFTYGFSFELP